MERKLSFRSTKSSKSEKSENSFKTYDGIVEYRIIKVIGKGTYSNVYFCQSVKQDEAAQVTEDDDDVVDYISDFDIEGVDFHFEELSKKGESMYQNFSALKTI